MKLICSASAAVMPIDHNRRFDERPDKKLSRRPVSQITADLVPSRPDRWSAINCQRSSRPTLVLEGMRQAEVSKIRLALLPHGARDRDTAVVLSLTRPAANQ
jgi:hypothetical protein